MIKDDFSRAERYNSKLGIISYIWIKKFVYSNILNLEVALAGTGDDIKLIKRSGEVVLILEKE